MGGGIAGRFESVDRKEVPEMNLNEPHTLTPEQRKKLLSAGVAMISELAVSPCECWRYGLDETDSVSCWPCRMRDLAHIARVTIR